MLAKEDLRRTVKYLEGGGTVWYAPDQDMRGKDSVFVPFFGVPAATITATHHLARLSGAAVIPFFHRRTADGAATRFVLKRRWRISRAPMSRRYRARQRLRRAHGARGAGAIPVGAQALQDTAARRRVPILTGMCAFRGYTAFRNVE